MSVEAEQTCDCDLGPEFTKITQPDGYIARQDWMAAKGKLYYQRKCPQCKLFSVWVPKETLHPINARTDHD